MFLDTIILLVCNENWPQANLHVTKENQSFKKNVWHKMYLQWSSLISSFEKKRTCDANYIRYESLRNSETI